MAGQVVGVVGRMGSGKSYFAIRTAYKRLRAGRRVASNFSMKLGPEASKLWTPFKGWEQFSELEDTLVIIDEAHLYAPSSQHLSFPMLAKWKLSQSRKFGLDVMWISQHEDRVNRTLRDLTNVMYVCKSVFSGAFFAVKGYEPEKMRRKGQHIDTRYYMMKPKIAGLYDTLEILDVDEHLVKGMEGARELLERRNAGRRVGPERSEDRPDSPSVAAHQEAFESGPVPVAEPLAQVVDELDDAWLAQYLDGRTVEELDADEAAWQRWQSSARRGSQRFWSPNVAR